MQFGCVMYMVPRIRLNKLNIVENANEIPSLGGINHAHLQEKFPTGHISGLQMHALSPRWLSTRQLVFILWIQ